MQQSVFKRDINKFNLLFISFAAIFGSGWLFAPFYAAQIAGPASLIAWCLGALMSAVIGITLAEVVTLFPRTGGLNAISEITHGNFQSLILIVLSLLVFILLPAIEVRAILQYCAAHYQFLVNAQNELSISGYLFAFFLLVVITVVNLYGSRLMTQITNFMVVLKVVTPILLCVAFLYKLKSSRQIDHSQLTSFFPIPWNQVFQAIATSGIIFSFNGFNQATIFAGEAKNPQKAIPFAILGSLFFSGCLYLLIQYTFLVSVPKDSLINGWGQLSFSGDQGPFAGLAILLGINWLLAIIYADAVISPLGTAFTYASAAPRLLYSLAEILQLFPSLKKMNSKGVPAIAIVLTFCLEMIAFVLLPSLKAMISLLVAAFVLCYTAAPASLLTLRKTHAHLKRDFKIRFPYFFCYLSVFFSNLMVFSCGWMALRNLAIAISVLISGYFLVLKKYTASPLQSSHRAFWFLFQAAVLVLIGYLDHIHLISYSASLIGIATLSGVSLFLSQLNVQLSFENSPISSRLISHMIGNRIKTFK